jgi:hypothetical protein
MQTLRHIKVGPCEGIEPTSEILSAACDEFMASGKTPWTMEIFRVSVQGVIRVTASAESLTYGEMTDTSRMIYNLLDETDGGVLVTRQSICISVTTKGQHTNEQA